MERVICIQLDLNVVISISDNTKQAEVSRTASNLVRYTEKGGDNKR